MPHIYLTKSNIYVCLFLMGVRNIANFPSFDYTHKETKSDVNFSSVAYQHINRQSFVLSQSSKSTKRERIGRSEKGLIHSCAVVFIACFLLVLAVLFDLSKSPSPAETTRVMQNK